MTKVKARYAKRVTTLTGASDTELLDELMKRVLKKQDEAIYFIDRSTNDFKSWSIHSNAGVIMKASFK